MTKTKYTTTFAGFHCAIYAGRYGNGTLAIVLKDAETDEQIAVATVAIEGVTPEPGAVILKTWSENHGIDRALWEGGVIDPDVIDEHRAGFVLANEHFLSDHFEAHLNELEGGSA